MQARAGAARVDICEVIGASAPGDPRVDFLAIEEPLEMRVGWREGGQEHERALAVTMRTPGHDAELTVGFLYNEGVVTRPEDVLACETSEGACRVLLADGARVASAATERHSYVSSSCGVCGKTSLDALRVRSPFPPPPCEAWIRPGVVHQMPETLRRAQDAFDATGGLHAAGLFDDAGALEIVREDVGRHNAVDKLAGALLAAGRLPLGRRVLVLSGRASFELVQKAALMGVGAIAAVGAPSSLAVELARAEGLTLLGFVRGGRFNVYAGAERIDGAPRG